MQNEIRFLAGAPNRFQIGDAALHQRDFAANFGEVVFFAGREIVEHNNAVSPLDQFVHGVRADKSGAARHQVAHPEYSSSRQKFAAGRKTHRLERARFAGRYATTRSSLASTPPLE